MINNKLKISAVLLCGVAACYATLQEPGRAVSEREASAVRGGCSGASSYNCSSGCGTAVHYQQGSSMTSEKVDNSLQSECDGSVSPPSGCGGKAPGNFLDCYE